MHRTMKDIVMVDNLSLVEKLISQVDHNEEIAIHNLDIIRNQIIGTEGQLLEKQARELLIDWKPIRSEVINLVRDGSRGKAAKITTEGGAFHVSLLEQKIFALSSYARNKADGFYHQATKVQKRVFVSTAAIILFGVTISLIIAHLVITLIMKSLQKVREADIKIIKEQEFTQKSIDSLRDTFFVFELNTGKTIRWNKQFQKISGYTENEITNLKAPDSYYSEEDLKKAASIIDEVLKFGTGRIEISLICKDGTKILTEYIASALNDEDGNPKYLISVGRDISERKLAEKERERLIKSLQKALNEIKTLKGIIPICSYCKQIRDDKGFWNQVESYVREHTEAEFTHGICPECMTKHHPEIDLNK